MKGSLRIRILMILVGLILHLSSASDALIEILLNRVEKVSRSFLHSSAFSKKVIV